MSNPNPQDTSQKNLSSQGVENDDRNVVAQSYFSKGERLFQAGKYGKAAIAFTTAYETLPHHTVLANIGLSHERAGAYPLAVEYLQKYVQALHDRGESDPSVDALLKETRARVAELVVVAEGFPEGCQIHVDSDHRSDSPLRVIVLPGTHRIRVVSTKKTEAEEQVSVAAGETKHFTMTEISRQPVAATTDNSNMTPSEKPPAAPDRLRNPLRIAVSSAVGFGVAAGILWGMTLSTKHEFDNLDTSEEKEALRLKGERLAVAAPVVTGVAGAATLTAIIIGLIRHSDSKKSDATGVIVTVLPGAMNLNVHF